jgi:two-component system, OmpR family, phosphate regulon sensor histidine kinase PhoR
MQPTRLFWRLFGTSGVIAGLLALSLAVLAAHRLASDQRRHGIEQLDRTARILETAIRGRQQWTGRGAPGVGRLIREVAAASSLSVTLMGSDGEVWADSTLAESEWSSQRHRPEIQQAMRSGMVGEDTRVGEELGGTVHYRAWPLWEDAVAGEPVAYLRLGRPVADPPQILFRAYLAMGGLAVVLWGASLVALYLSLSNRLAPLERLVAWARGVAAGQDESFFAHPRTGEIGSLAAAIEQMQVNRASRHDQLMEKSKLLGSVLGNMLEGVVAVDSDEVVLVANAASGRMLGFSSEAAPGRVLLELTRCRPLHDAVQQAIQTGLAVNQEIEAPGPQRRALAIRAAPLSEEARQGVMVVIHDVTELRRLENLRREFVANVSHELKTPLASIKAYSETLRMGAIDDVEHRLDFVARIEEQAERLHELIIDLLQLARVEAGREALEIVPLALRPLVEACRDQYVPLAGSKEMMVLVAPDLPDVAVMADEEGLRTILSNLVDNAIKYTSSGGTVTLSWQLVAGWVELAVTDTGIGIAPREQARIFERFYRIDKARSRELGGTGLGLSIVKHLAQALGGDVGVRSRLGEGSTFLVRLPLAPSTRADREQQRSFTSAS